MDIIVEFMVACHRCICSDVVCDAIDHVVYTLGWPLHRC
jgi:hypothetical protein